MFRNDSEETSEEDVKHNAREERHYSPAKDTGSKDLETRITYQYPKGHFRFPIIPDEESTNPHHREQVKREVPHLEGMRPAAAYPKTYPKVQANPDRKPDKKPLPKVSSRPFHPTKIPSPIFGYHRPKDIVVEYELSHLERNGLNDQDHFDHAVGPITKKEMIVKNFQKDPAETVVIDGEVPSTQPELPDISATENGAAAFSETEKAPALQNAADVPVYSGGTFRIQPELLDDRERENDETAPGRVETEKLSVIRSNPNLLDDTDSAALNVKELPAQAELETEKMATTLMEEESASPDDPDTADRANQPELQAEAEKAPAEIAAVAVAEESASPDDPDAADREVPVAAELQVPPAKGQEEAPEDRVQNPDRETAEPAKPRRHLPFNVLMLKQDKRKWEERKRNQATVQEVRLQHVPKATAETAQPTAQTYIQPAESSHSVRTSQPDTDKGNYEFPSLQLLKPPVTEALDSDWLIEQENLLNQTLENFNVGAKVVNVTQGPAVTRFEVHPDPGVKVNKVTNLTDDIKLSLAARDIRIEAPIPGKHTIGIEVPNLKSRPVRISEIIRSRVFLESVSPLTAVLGLDISGKPIVTDLKKMPHGLIAGATGSGKSVCINSILISLLYKASPEDLKLLLIDPKMVELAPYNRIPHLVSPVITDIKAATAALKWAVDEMERRYELFAHAGVRDINRFNELAMKHGQYADKLPFIVIVIDELADLMMMSPADVEEAICRIAQKARACGIHLIIATQRPSVDVITGLIKANIPTRIAFSVSSQVDSRTIIDISGAEKLLGRGDMLFLENGSSKSVRLQGTFVSDEEIDMVVDHIRKQREPDYLFEQEELLKKAQVADDEDELFYEACEFVVSQSCASTSSLQRQFKIGYNRAARLMDMMEQHGYISGSNGSKPREVFLSETDLESIQETSL